MPFFFKYFKIIGEIDTWEWWRKRVLVKTKLESYKTTHFGKQANRFLLHHPKTERSNANDNLKQQRKKINKSHMKFTP